MIQTQRKNSPFQQNEPDDYTDIENLKDCSICMETFNGHTLRPRILPCGHTMCKNCVHKSVSYGTVVCPHCKRNFRATHAGRFPINYSLEALILSLRKSCSIKTQPPDENVNVSHRFREVFCNQKDSVKTLLKAAEEVQSHLYIYENSLCERRAKHEDFIVQIRDLMQQHESMIDAIDAEHQMLNGLMREGREFREICNVKLSKYSDFTASTNILSASEELEKCQQDLELWQEICNTQFPCVQTIRTSDKIICDTEVAMAMIGGDTEKDSANNSNLYGLRLAEKLNILVDRELKLKSFQDNVETIKNLIERGHVYGIQLKERGTRSARITVRDNKTYLHYLQDCAPPLNAYTIQQSCLLETLNKDSEVVFVDLSWDGSVQGRVLIQLVPETSLGQHFRILCTGDLGFTYAQTNFLDVYKKNSDTYDAVLAGDYEHNNGNGGACLIEDLTMGGDACKRKDVSGLLWSRYNQTGGQTSAQFGISIGEGTEHTLVGVFGQVIDSLDTVKAAAKVEDIKSVTISDCGVVLPM